MKCFSKLHVHVNDANGRVSKVKRELPRDPLDHTVVFLVSFLNIFQPAPTFESSISNALIFCRFQLMKKRHSLTLLTI